MRRANGIPRDWREREFVTLSEAAAIARRSYSWAHDRTISGTLSACHRPSGPMVVTTSSLARFLDSEGAAPKRRQSYPHYLRLVVDNSDKWLLRGGRPKRQPPALVTTDHEHRPDRAA